MIKNSVRPMAREIRMRIIKIWVEFLLFDRRLKRYYCAVS
jgi:hypothetical protein